MRHFFLLIVLLPIVLSQHLRTGFEVYLGNVSFPRMGYQLEAQECFDIISNVGSDMDEQALLRQLQDSKLECFLLPSDTIDEDIFNITTQLRAIGFEVRVEDTIEKNEEAPIQTRIFLQYFQHQTLSKHFVSILYYLDYENGLVITLEETEVD
jgi:hypothetical protein